MALSAGTVSKYDGYDIKLQTILMKRELKRV
jgi:hypothetical protein